MKDRERKHSSNIHFIAFIIIFLLAACGQKPTYASTFEQAKGLINSNPDSALTLLYSLQLQEMGDMQHYIQAELLEKGYDKNSSFDIVTSISLKEQKCAVKISVYDANTCTLTTDKEMNMGGSWY